MPAMTTGIRSWLGVVACVAALAVAGCGKSGAGKYGDELSDAGFQNVSVTRDEEGSGNTVGARPGRRAPTNQIRTRRPRGPRAA